MSILGISKSPNGFFIRSLRERFDCLYSGMMQPTLTLKLKVFFNKGIEGWNKFIIQELDNLLLISFRFYLKENRNSYKTKHGLKRFGNKISDILSAFILAIVREGNVDLPRILPGEWWLMDHLLRDSETKYFRTLCDLNLGTSGSYRSV